MKIKYKGEHQENDDIELIIECSNNVLFGLQWFLKLKNQRCCLQDLSKVVLVLPVGLEKHV